MELVEFWGLTFRSASHMHWFQLSVGGFIVSNVWFLLRCIFPREQKIFSFFIPWFCLFWWHVVTSVSAIAITKFGTVNGPRYSVDCIWFNALAAGIYFVLFYFIGRLLKRGLPKN